MINNKEVDVFNEEELEEIRSSINTELSKRETIEWDDSTMGKTHEENFIRIKRNHLGRLEINNLPLSATLREKVWWLAQNMYQLEGSYAKNISGITYVEYNPIYGTPELNVHKDSGTCGLILDYQLESNTSWDFGVNESLYELKDNEILAMYPLTDYHWRPKKNWNNGEFVKLIFFEFLTPGVQKIEDEEKKNSVTKFVESLDQGDKNVL